MLVILAAGGGYQIGLAVRDDPGGIGRLNFHFAAFQELEETLGVFLFLQGGFLEDVADQNVAIAFGFGSKEVVTVAGLRFTGKSGQDVFLGLGTFQRFHMLSPEPWLCWCAWC